MRLGILSSVSSIGSHSWDIASAVSNSAAELSGAILLHRCLSCMDSLDHIGSFRAAVGKSSSSVLLFESAESRGMSLNVSHLQTA